MMKFLTKGGWLTALFLFALPIFLISGLGAQMAYGQVKGQYDEYLDITEVTNLSQLRALQMGDLLMLRGKIVDGPMLLPEAEGMVVFQERPLDGREIRFREEFPLRYPEFELGLPDGTVLIKPSEERERVISHELHRSVAGDREYTGFRLGDTVMVQGEWGGENAGIPTLQEVTGITSIDRAALVAEWDYAFYRLSLIRNILMGLSLISLIALSHRLIQQIRQKNARDSQPEPTLATILGKEP